MSLFKKHLQSVGIDQSSDQGNNGNGGDQSGGTGNSGGAGDGNAEGGNGTAGDEAGKEKGGAGAAGGGANSSTSQQQGSDDIPELTEEQLLLALKKRGVETDKLENLTVRGEQTVELTEDQKAEQAQRRANEIRSYALQTNKVTTTALDKYARESALPAEVLALDQYKRNRIAELKQQSTPDADLPTDEDLEAEFKEVNFLYADETDPKRKAAMRRLENEKDLYLQETYAPIYDMEGDYEAHQAAKTDRSKYSTSLDAAFKIVGSELEFKMEGLDKKEVSYPVKISESEIAAVKALYEGDPLFNTFRADADPQKIAEAIKATIVARNASKFIADISNAHLSKGIEEIKKGRRHIPISTVTGDNANTEKESLPMVSKMLSRAGVNPTPKSN